VILGGRILWSVLAATAALGLVGCRTAETRLPRRLTNVALGALSPQALRQAYQTPAMVVRASDGGRHVAVQDTLLAADSALDDGNLIIFVEGAGDSEVGFRRTASLLVESRHAFPLASDSLVVVLLKWSRSSSVLISHMDHAAQQEGAAHLAEMLEVHRRRHGPFGHVSVIGFSAGTRVIESAFAAAEGDAAWHPEALAQVDHVVFLGSSVAADDATPYTGIRGRFLNFVNPRDTHFGDRATFVAPAGEKADPVRLLKQATIERRPLSGASVAGFRRLPTLTAVEQFDAAETVESLLVPGAGGEVTRRAFKRINVPVPSDLMAYNVFGMAQPNDDFDDYLNQAPNHYILVGRGPSGRLEVPDFRQYRAVAEEFVREHVAAAAMRGRLYRFDLKAQAQAANPTGLPLPVPWAIWRGPEASDGDGVPEAPPPPGP
jgi:hypothetical protein